MKLRLLDLGSVPWLRSQTIFHGIAHAFDDDSPDTITLICPDQPYVCLGYHQAAEKEVDLDFCRAEGLPVTRREVGGGAVYLDSGQVFYHWIFNPRHLPAQIEEVFRLYCRTLVDTYRAIGIPAEHRPVNDILVHGRKIGGTGAAAIGGATVLAGSLMFDFNFELMARVLKVPSEKFRDKLRQGLHDYMTTMKRELGVEPDRRMVKDTLIEQCRRSLGAETVAGELTVAERDHIAALDARFLSPAWLFQQGTLREEGVKIRDGVRVVEAVHKAPGGLIRVIARLHEGRLDDLAISGDFFFHPATHLGLLEQALRGAQVEEATLRARVQDFYTRQAIETPGVGIEDWVTALLLVVTP